MQTQINQTTHQPANLADWHSNLLALGQARKLSPEVHTPKNVPLFKANQAVRATVRDCPQSLFAHLF